VIATHMEVFVLLKLSHNVFGTAKQKHSYILKPGIKLQSHTLVSFTSEECDI